MYWGEHTNTHAESITGRELRDALAEFTCDSEVIFGEVPEGKVMFYRFKTRGEKSLQMEFNIEPYAMD